MAHHGIAALQALVTFATDSASCLVCKALIDVSASKCSPSLDISYFQGLFGCDRLFTTLAKIMEKTI